MQLAVRRNRRETSWFEKLASIGFGFAGTGALMIAMLLSYESCQGKEAAARTEPALAQLEDVDLISTCKGNVMLATASRAALCMSPWHEAECADDTVMRMYMELSSCEATSTPSAAVAMVAVPERELEKIAPIDPEPLLEELTQKPPEPPKPQPQLQPQPPQPQPPAPPPPPPPQRKQQVVETVKPQNEQKPDPNTRLLSEHDIAVKEQKVNRGARNEPMVAKAKPEDLVAKKEPPKEDPSMQKPPDKPPGKNPKAPDNPTSLAMRPPGTPAPATAPQEEIKRGAQVASREPVMQGGFVPRTGTGSIEQQRKDPGEITKGQGGGGGGAPQTPILKPTKEQLERIVGGGNVDHLDDVKEGDETALSSKRWVYASFFNRLKRQVAQNWDPQTVWRRTDPDGTHHGFKTRITEVRVVLSSKGDLSKIVVTSPSGVKELDDEAVRAFHAAAPFPNPPDGLAGKSGDITFAFSFHFEIGQSSTSWRVIRQ